MTTKTKGRNGGDRPTQKIPTSDNLTGTAPLARYDRLVKASRINRQHERGWQREGQ